MKRLIYFTFAFILAFGHVSATTCSSIESEIKKDIERRFENAHVWNIKFQSWGAYYVEITAKSAFKEITEVTAVYDAKLNWVQDKYYLSSYLHKELILKVQQMDGHHPMKELMYYETAFSDPYYKIELDNGRYMFLSSSLEKMEHGPLRTGIVLNDDLKKDVYSKARNVEIIEGHIGPQNEWMFEVVVEFKEDYNVPGRITYTPGASWLSTSLFIEQYDLLSDGLAQFIDQNGGREAFIRLTISETKAQPLVYYVTLEGKTLKLDQNLNRL